MNQKRDYRSKRLSEIKNEFEKGVFLVNYNSPKQKAHRCAAFLLLSLKHILRGVLFSWPLYMLALAVYSLPHIPVWFMLVFLLPALYVSWVILRRGIREDYSNLVDGYLLQSGYLGRLLFRGTV
jgi:hypothetical protein